MTDYTRRLSMFTPLEYVDRMNLLGLVLGHSAAELSVPLVATGGSEITHYALCTVLTPAVEASWSAIKADLGLVPDLSPAYTIEEMQEAVANTTLHFTDATTNEFQTVIAAAGLEMYEE